MHTTINRAGWLVAGVLALFVVAAMTGVVSGGPLDPPGAPSATGTLPQVEPRSPIPPVGWNGTFPIVISVPGSYFLTRSLTATATNTDGIQITGDNVAIDLGGFTVSGFDKTGSGVTVIAQHTGIRIGNGVVRHWGKGISGWWPGGEAVYSRVDHVTALDNNYGILLGSNSEITECNASANTTDGIQTHYGVVRGCYVSDNSGRGIYAVDLSLVEDNKVSNNAYGIAVGSIVTPGGNTIRSNTTINNTIADIEIDGSDSVADFNVVTCSAHFVINGIANTLDNRFQRGCP